MSSVYYKGQKVFEGTYPECADFVCADCLGDTEYYNILPS